MKKLFLFAFVAISIFSSNAQIRTTYDGLKKMQLDIQSCNRMIVDAAVRIDISVTGRDSSRDAVFIGSDGYTQVKDDIGNYYNVYVTASSANPTSGRVAIDLNQGQTKTVSFYIYNVDKRAKYISFTRMQLQRSAYSSNISILNLPIK